MSALHEKERKSKALFVIQWFLPAPSVYITKCRANARSAQERNARRVGTRSRRSPAAGVASVLLPRLFMETVTTNSHVPPWGHIRSHVDVHNVAPAVVSDK